MKTRSRIKTRGATLSGLKRRKSDPSVSGSGMDDYGSGSGSGSGEDYVDDTNYFEQLPTDVVALILKQACWARVSPLDHVRSSVWRGSLGGASVRRMKKFRYMRYAQVEIVF